LRLSRDLLDALWNHHDGYPVKESFRQRHARWTPFGRSPAPVDHPEGVMTLGADDGIVAA